MTEQVYRIAAKTERLASYFGPSPLLQEGVEKTCNGALGQLEVEIVGRLVRIAEVGMHLTPIRQAARAASRATPTP